MIDVVRPRYTPDEQLFERHWNEILSHASCQFGKTGAEDASQQHHIKKKILLDQVIRLNLSTLYIRAATPRPHPVNVKCMFRLPSTTSAGPCDNKETSNTVHRTPPPHSVFASSSPHILLVFSVVAVATPLPSVLVPSQTA